jgi:hypothetical protein
MREIFNSDLRADVFVQYIEIYNETLSDLLDNNTKALKIDGENVVGAKKVKISSIKDVLTLLEIGEE